MPLMEYLCEDCQNPELKAKAGGKQVSVIQEVWTNKAVCDPIGHRRKCQLAGCNHMMKRIVSSRFGIVIKGSKLPQFTDGEVMQTRLNGQDVRFQFIDHPETDPEYHRNLAEIGRRQGIGESQGLGNARYDPKRGGMVVDVLSNVPDPLGKLEAAKKQGNEYTVTKKKVNTPVKRRSKAK